MDSSSDCVRVIQWDTGVTCGELTQHTRGRASSCDIKPNRPMRLVSGGMDDSKVYCHSGPPFKRIVDGVPEEAVHVKGAVNGLQFSSNGLLLVSAGADRTVAIYDGKTMELKSKLENVHQGTIYGCVWNSNDTHILTCSADGTAKLLSAVPLEVVHTWDVVELLSGESKTSTPIGAMVTGCAFIKDDIPVVVTINGEIGLLPKPPMFPNGLVDYEKYTGHVAPITGMAIDISRGFLYTGDSDGVLCQFSLATNEPVKRFSNPESTDLLGKMHGDAIISCLTVTCLGEVMTAGWDDTVRKIDVTGNTVNPPNSLDAQPNAIATGTELTVILTVKGILMIRCDGAVSSLQSLDYVALSVCVSLDDSTIYVGGEDCKIHVYNVSSAFKLEEIQSIEGAHLKPIYALSLSHDQTKLASSDVRDICIRDTTSSEFKCIIGKSRWCFHTQRITCLAWSMDDNVLASGGADDSLYLWSLRRPSKRLHYPFSHRGGVTGLSFFPLGSNEPFMGCGRLVSVGSDACVNQWDVQKDIESKFS
jgi:WD repeat-containing protein 1 (actin-interacting protein 1)